MRVYQFRHSDAADKSIGTASVNPSIECYPSTRYQSSMFQV
jgi:hypothetical protein